MKQPAMLNRRAFLGASAATIVGLQSLAAPGRTLDLARVKTDVLTYCETLRDLSAVIVRDPRKRPDAAVGAAEN